MANNLTGKKFGRLFVVERTEKPKHLSSKNKYIHWKCICDCGTNKEIIVASNSLIKGKTLSCGCYQKDIASEINGTHRKTKTKLYTIWLAIKRRCNYKNDVRYSIYGGKGIVICNEWEHDFLVFESWAINNGYLEELSIDRIDVNGNYEPDNCRWVTMKVQQNNRSNNRLLEYNGQTLTLSEWSDKTGINLKVLHARLNKLGWSVKKALTKPLRKVVWNK